MILKVFLWFACNSDVLKSRFYYRKTAIFTDLHVFWKCWFLSSFIYILSIWASIFVIFSHTFQLQFCSQFFKRFLVQKRCPKWTQNHPKIDPSASQGGLWLPGFIRSFLDMPFLRFLMPKWLPKCAKNDPIEPPMVPRTIKVSHFPPNGRSGIVLLGVSGRIPSHLLLMV